MGTSNSSRRNDMDEALSDSDEDTHIVQNYAVTLAQIINNSRIHIVSSPWFNNNNSDDDDDDFEHDHVVQSRPIGDYAPDTGQIEVSMLKSELCRNTPRLYSGKFDALCSVLSKREMGGCRQGSFSRGDKCYLAAQFIPNCVSKINLHNVKAFCGIFSEDGDVFVSSTQDHIIRMYDTSQGRFTVRRLVYARDVGWSVLDTAFSPDSRNLVYSSWSKYIHMCAVTEESDTHRALPIDPDRNNFAVFSLAFSSDSKEILAGANDGCIYIYDLEANIRSMKIDAHDDDIHSVVFADETSNLMYSSGDDAVIKVWDRRTLSEECPCPVGELAGHTDGVTFIDSKGDARYLISNSKDQTIKLWDIRRFSCEKAIQSTRKSVSAQNWDYRWQPVPTRLRQSRKPHESDSSLMTYRGHCVLHTLIRARFSPLESTAQNFIYSGCASGDVFVYNILTGKVISRLRGHGHCVRDVSWHPYRNLIATSSWDGSVGVWTYRSGDSLDEDTWRDPEDSLPVRRSSSLRQRSHHSHAS